MTKRIVHVPDEMHEDLRAPAFTERTTMAALIRQATETAFEDELDATVMDRELEECAWAPIQECVGRSSRRASDLRCRIELKRRKRSA